MDLHFKIDRLEYDKDLLTTKIKNLTDGKRHCDSYCKVCHHSYVKTYNSFMGGYIYGCILDISCPDFVSTRPFMSIDFCEEETKK